jgi:hypothetical protein
MPAHWCYVQPSSAEWMIIKEYLLDDDRLRIFGPKFPWSHGFSLNANRRVLKLIRMAPLIQLIQEDLGMSVVYLVRHPIPHSLSSIKRRHVPHLEEFIENSSFMRSHCTSRQRDIVTRIARTGSMREKFVAEWSLTNLFPYRYLPLGEHSIWITYEEMVMFPSRFEMLLDARLGLSDVPALQKRYQKPSKRADRSDKSWMQGVAANDKKILLRNWRSKISTSEEELLLELAADLGVGIYSTGEDLPVNWPSLT